jgi:hypothetical protein
MTTIPRDPMLQKILVEDHEREILEDVEAQRLAEGEIPADEYDQMADDYQPVTEEGDEFFPSRHENRHVHKDEQ